MTRPTRLQRDLYRAAGLNPPEFVTEQRGIVCLHPDPDLPDPGRKARFRAKGGTLVALLIRERIAEEQAPEIARLRIMATPVDPGPDGDDHGMDLGPAALARGGTIARVGGKLRGAAQRNATPVYARMIDATDLFERLNIAGQLSDRQAKAGRRMLMLKRAAGIDPRITARYPVVNDTTPGDLDTDVDEVLEAVCPEEFDPRTYYRHLLRQVPYAADMIDSACDWTADRPVGRPETRRLATFQAALDQIADVLKIKHEGIGV